jgi:hypothetical protein
MAVVLAVVAAYGLLKIHREYPARWARILPQSSASESPAIDLQRALHQIEDADGPKVGSRLPLAEFVQSDGSLIRVLLVEGQFFDRSIEPRRIWQALGRNVTLVSSVDEHRSSTGNLSNPVTAGCAIPEEEFIQQLGSTSITECHGIYREKFHIHDLARMSVVVGASNAEQSPCWEHYGLSGQENYQLCISNALGSGLQNLFSEIDRRRYIDAMVLPAIATGTGKLSKAAFYNKLLVETLVPQLKDSDHYIPRTIYLQVWHGDPDKRWPETKIAIAGAVANAVERWDFRSEHKVPDSEWLSVTGVAIGSCFMLIALAAGVRVGFVSNLLPIVSPFRPLLVLSWVAAAIGLVSVFKLFFGFLPVHFSPYWQVAAGALAAPLCEPMARADDAVKGLFKTDPPSHAGSSSQPKTRETPP